MAKLTTRSPDLELVDPNVERDAPIAVQWLEGDVGKTTLRLMGNTDANIKTPTLEEEKERIEGFIKSEEQITWMISLRDKTVGAIWVDLKSTEYLSAPAIHIMIGDINARGQGVGTNAMLAVIDYLRDGGEYKELYTRHLVDNEAATKLAEGIGFNNLGQPYTDNDRLSWQNSNLSLV